MTLGMINLSASHLRVAICLAAVCVVPACAPTVRQAPAPILAANGMSQGTLHLTLQQGNDIFDDVNQITATAVTSDGEMFTGRVVQNIERTNSSSSDTIWDSSKKTKHGWSTQFRDGTDTSISYRSDAQAVLTGNRGRAMTCDFRLANPEAGIGGGGVGQCRISDGRQVPVQF
ncbi:hypothetical protein [Pannonibacter carbonis]|uniref:hypothetical protein n=1 Tax=Pannonibacter carbonis TaxID=2067569 RepID=UPI000D0E3916|nr:hypothetical protein [Pannonibacter carbonis]